MRASIGAAFWLRRPSSVTIIYLFKQYSQLHSVPGEEWMGRIKIVTNEENKIFVYLRNPFRCTLVHCELL